MGATGLPCVQWWRNSPKERHEIVLVIPEVSWHLSNSSNITIKTYPHGLHSGGFERRVPEIL